MGDDKTDIFALKKVKELGGKGVFVGERKPPEADILLRNVVREQLLYPEGRPLYAVHQVTRNAVYYLPPYATYVATNNRLSLPHGLRDNEAETFPYRFLNHDRCSPLQGVYLHVAVRREV